MQCLQQILSPQLLDPQQLYRNYLKNREFDKEAPQNSRPQRVTIAERQGASEEENSEEKLTQSKADSSSSFGIDEIDRETMRCVESGIRTVFGIN